MRKWVRELGSQKKGIVIATNLPPITPPPPLPVVIEFVTRRGPTGEEPEETDEEDNEEDFPRTLKWWYAYQNNPMGVDDYFPEKGVGQYVCFEAYSKDDADTRFQDSVRPTSSRECDCCGERWEWGLNGSGTDEPTIYGKSIKEHLTEGNYTCGMSIFLHYWDGSIVEVVSRRASK
jgi:hypothetical protein